MRALTLHQPWATLIALGVKTIETRSWKAPDALIGERFAIHAAKRMPDMAWEGGGWATASVWTSFTGTVPLLYRDIVDDGIPCPLGAVVATARLVDCIPMVDRPDIGSAYDVAEPVALVLGRNNALWHKVGDTIADMSDQRPFGDFAAGRWAWMLDDIEPLPEPVPAKGRQGLWNWEPDQ